MHIFMRSIRPQSLLHVSLWWTILHTTVFPLAKQDKFTFTTRRIFYENLDLICERSPPKIVSCQPIFETWASRSTRSSVEAVRRCNYPSMNVFAPLPTPQCTCTDREKSIRIRNEGHFFCLTEPSTNTDAKPRRMARPFQEIRGRSKLLPFTHRCGVMGSDGFNRSIVPYVWVAVLAAGSPSIFHPTVFHPSFARASPVSSGRCCFRSAFDPCLTMSCIHFLFYFCIHQLNPFIGVPDIWRNIVYIYSDPSCLGSCGWSC